MKRTPLKRKTTLKHRSKRVKRPLGASKRKKTIYTPPDWFQAIKPGSHGNSPAQKRLWRVVSETVRKEEHAKYGGRCVSCQRYIPTWQEGHCGHYKAWSVCNGFFKYEKRNLALQCKMCNLLSDGPTGQAFARELQLRHGQGILDWIEEENNRHRGEKLDILVIVGLAALWLGISHEQ